ncbi:tRNA pseudouridine(55) synthase TruB [Halodesulfovibrio marinisediminis]|uniref:tRNA pseudouridine synthase B n=1 Tax=Halodesulfovibrio marinisediminis DSM 17456 TaxID=1121457 RepID=A0A1N6FHY2_9BACT|nr:tRNA pseudouridine(55) synthase TruB [Halodesulfovibrio marinisediminis]SIN94865.1 tRNA pseudouridine synthase B [Halodesulfovibrio marinisediminis DSM 17456]
MAQVPQQHGILLLNKPKGPSSGGCIGKIKRLGQKKIGHAGTLDPMAQGLLVVLLGQGTKLSNYLMTGGEKVYSGTIKLGETTDTWDAEGQVTATADWQHITEEDVRAEVAHWLEITEQEVPAYSAAKHKGKSLYKLAREGKETPVKIKTVKISEAATLSVELPFLRFRVRCSTGTYIRSLAHSLGIRLKCGAVLTELIREYSHPFSLDNACEPDELVENPDLLESKVIPLEQALPTWPKIILNNEEVALVKNGNPIPYDPEKIAQMPFSVGINAMLLDSDRTPLALAETNIVQRQPVWSVLRGLWQS